MTSSPAARHHPNAGDGALCGPAPVRREYPGPVPAETVALALQWLRGLQDALDTAPGWRDKASARGYADDLQRLLGGSDERGRRADGSRPRENGHVR